MKLAPMRFGGVSMRHNPEKLHISDKNRLQEYLSPCCEADSQVLGRELCRVSGEGVLFGTDCIEQYHTLEMLQRNHTPAKLVLPKMQPLYAYLKELSVSAEPQDDVLHYRFVFCETKSPRKATGRAVLCDGVIGREPVGYRLHLRQTDRRADGAESSDPADRRYR